MASDTEFPVRLTMEVLGMGRIMDAVTGDAVHAPPGAGIPDLLALRVGHIVLVLMAGVACVHRTLGHEDRVIAAVRLMAGAAVQAVTVALEPAGPSCGRTARVVTGQAERLLGLIQEAAAVGSVGVVADLAVSAAGGHMGERSGPGALHLILVALAAQLVQWQAGGERLLRAGQCMAGGATSGFERWMEPLAEQAGLG